MLLEDFGDMKIVKKAKKEEEYEIEYGNIDFRPSIELPLISIINSNNNSDTFVIELEDKYNIILSNLKIDINKFNYENINPHECLLYTFEFITTIGDIPFEWKIDDAWISRFSNIREMTLETRATSRLIINKLIE
ncbi:hypothetical protein [Clostridium sp. UBA7791]|uniref:hypothetical protein n=1 Tax=Clostridium sp. UBA7791 TaxID=1946379 RepID=UPI003216F293